jgi:hypothetical protein
MALGFEDPAHVSADEARTGDKNPATDTVVGGRLTNGGRVVVGGGVVVSGVVVGGVVVSGVVVGGVVGGVVVGGVVVGGVVGDEATVGGEVDVTACGEVEVTTADEVEVTVGDGSVHAAFAGTAFPDNAITETAAASATAAAVRRRLSTAVALLRIDPEPPTFACRRRRFHYVTGRGSAERVFDYPFSDAFPDASRQKAANRGLERGSPAFPSPQLWQELAGLFQPAARAVAIPLEHQPQAVEGEVLIVLVDGV